jgi:hypothetical protein
MEHKTRLIKLQFTEMDTQTKQGTIQLKYPLPRALLNNWQLKNET